MDLVDLVDFLPYLPLRSAFSQELCREGTRAWAGLCHHTGATHRFTSLCLGLFLCTLRLSLCFPSTT